MKERTLKRELVVARPLEETFAFFSDPRNLEAITPPWLRFRIVSAPERLAAGAQIDYRLSLFRIPFRWRSEIVDWDPPRGFTDVAQRGPFRLWIHRHELAAAPGGTRIRDHVRYRAPLGERLVRRWLERIFDYRMQRLAVRLDEPPARATVSRS
jgi:ligand-binding SRPBCC domain-containing protein